MAQRAALFNGNAAFRPIAVSSARGQEGVKLDVHAV